MDSTKRFSNRVEDYVKYRPHYPADIITYLQEGYGLSAGKQLADIGAGTGISTSLFLEAGYPVFAVEPNEEMLGKAKELLGQYTGFTPVQGTAENTTLPSGSVDGIIAGQAFHWFNVPACKVEFKRILQSDGLVALIWNERRVGSPFEQEYDALINKHGKDYVQVGHRNIDAEHIGAFFAPAAMELKVFANEQVFDYDGLKGRLLSSSYMPLQGDPGFEVMIADLEALFGKYEQEGRIVISYDTKVYVGRL
ncbi:class I SAM-dependent methyltransferase [Chitinophaga agrisoli]|uniref:Class I SAM-dependent methyltransferase n=1 Tax=Chitinophaga agrisoli TaxID=2607653 RepID=A0A5B2VQN3_9BACT|nr:class I SAM-dependent methyltransferase [Chitinophaga agrisoli]KAA2241501.1 class I SAM-dependent methyltransferase [Chitinophaga agrisoli]